MLERWRTEQGDGYVVSLVRAILGVLLAWTAFRDVRELADGAYFGDVFHLPIVPEALVPSRALFAALVFLECVLALLVIAGRAARPALFASGVVGIYFILCDRVRYHNNRYALFLFAIILAFAPCDRAFVPRVEPLGNTRRGGLRSVVLARTLPAAARSGPLWAQRLAQVQLAIIYLASGGSKLFDPDWRSGRVIGDRLVRSASLAISKGVPAELMLFLSGPAVASGLSKLAIATELLLAVALFAPRTRFFALYWGVMFHLTIEVTSKVELFTWLTLAVYALFARPTLRERALLYDEGRPAGRFAMRAIRALDWLARFEVRADREGAGGHAFVVVDRDGSSQAGIAALARIARAIPLLFPLSVPLFVAALPLRVVRPEAKPG